MARARTRPITDINISKGDMRKLRKGHVIYRMANKHMHCIRCGEVSTKTLKRIAKLEAELKKLRGSTNVTSFIEKDIHVIQKVGEGTEKGSEC